MSKTSPIARLRRELLAWYDREGRSLPWRIRPEDRAAGAVADPYAIWLSEIMLQQTTVPHATPYWHRFLALWPRVQDLAAAPRDDVLREWAGLGYYARARNLHACAIEVATKHGGKFPDTMEGLRALPGIGDYTANAILAAAFGKPASVVDGNVERVITRLYRVATAMPKAKPEIRKRAAAIADPVRSGDYAQAIMDLGATVCTPRAPDCAACCWNFACAAATAGDMERYPVKPPKKRKPVRRGTAWLVRRGGRIWLRRRAESGLLGGMTEIPSTDWIESAGLETRVGAEPPFDADWIARGEVRHVFTHFELRLEVREGEAGMAWEPDSGYWAHVDALDAEALPSVMRKVLMMRGG
ncbi:A/G-specific adenine glycosylase [Maricaulis sp. W15]|uniref:Adenine DNA glycosylase n=1 Tax=Maricaulis maris TaxID=74318 RepID=A0A495DDQ0_9PROT|nr:MULTISPECIES: A/G-specific adenine glycosylase [Maricaulis]OLF80835.1 A/G-specific adenine glycosylase [Maricaulis sp. W15]RKR00421.1 A/G-specific DNA-adenine glycosylase [Maricaulis maris]